MATRRGPLGRFVLRVVAWLPIAFAAWYFAAPVLVFPVLWIVRAASSAALADLVRGVDLAGAILTFATTLRPGNAAAQGTVTVDVDAMLYAFGLPLYAALALAARQPGRVRGLAIGYAVMLPAIAWGVLADFLRNVAITSGPMIASQTGFAPWQREAIAFAYQLGSLILPTVVPAATWVATHRRFLEILRRAPADAPA